MGQMNGPKRIQTVLQSKDDGNNIVAITFGPNEMNHSINLSFVICC